MPFSRASLVRCLVSTVGTGSPLTIGSAVAGYRALSVIPDGSWVAYALQDTNGNETGWGQISGSGTSLTRNLEASSTGSLISLSGAAVMIVTPLPRDFMENNLIAHALQGGI